MTADRQPIKPDALHGRNCNPTPRLCQNKRRLFRPPNGRFFILRPPSFLPGKISCLIFLFAMSSERKIGWGPGATVHFFPHFDPKAFTPDGAKTESGADPEASPKSDGQRLHGPPIGTVSERAPARRECRDLLVCELHHSGKETFS